jgi:hypothetical protein
MRVSRSSQRHSYASGAPNPVTLQNMDSASSSQTRAPVFSLVVEKIKLFPSRSKEVCRLEGAPAIGGTNTQGTKVENRYPLILLDSLNQGLLEHRVLLAFYRNQMD